MNVNFEFVIFLHIDSDNSSTNSSPAITPNSVDEQHQFHGKIGKKKQREWSQSAARQKFDQRKELIIDLFKKYGIFPSPKDIDAFLVNIFQFQFAFISGINLEQI